MKLIPELFEKKIFTLLTAPVAKGKTHAIIDYYDNNICRMVFVSPLRALANEIFEKLKHQKNVYLIGGTSEKVNSKNDQFLNFLQKKKAMIITTAEMLEDEFLELISQDDNPIIFVLDEFHLFYSWGESFRPILHDTYLGILCTEHPVIALSATMNDLHLKALKKDLEFDRNFWIHLDFGNLELYRKPKNITFFGGFDKSTLERAFTRELKNKNKGQVFLMFCSYRSEVEEKVNWAKRHHFHALGCVGGEVLKFQEELKNCDHNQLELDCIFATSTLSHGVNLPEITKVFINYEVKDYNFWLQMIGRGGRNGSSYDVYSFDQFHLTKKQRIYDYVKVPLSDWIGIEI